MPADETAALTDSHRIAQARIGARAAAGVMADWQQMVHAGAPALSAGPWLDSSLGRIRSARGASERLAVSYTRLHRAYATGSTLPPAGSGPPARRTTIGQLRSDYAALAGERPHARPQDARVVPVEEFDWPEPDEQSMDDAARTSLWVTGPVHAEQRLDAAEALHGRGRLDDAEFLAELDDMMRDCAATVGGAADREVLRGGRSLAEQSARADGRVVGWARVTDSSPCGFCAMLASRGAVYKSRDSALFAGGPPVSLDDLTKYHDLCHCQIVPVYSRADHMPAGSVAWRDLWQEASDGRTGRDVRRAFDRAVAARRLAVRRRGLPTNRRS
ncbi:hypothetical protein ACIQF6_14810 [Kitasatospora sp. NPDC092948]|uniref:VG15 protein n=1 Tax=Kitasatospora sp. NPDC092948 TaxID=3364088 RepID=UPI0038134153